MPKFKPGFWFTHRVKTNVLTSEWVEFKTYAELKRNIKKYLLESNEPYLTVYRSRRGEWGEWVEQWVLDNNKIKIINMFWQ